MMHLGNVTEFTEQKNVRISQLNSKLATLPPPHFTIPDVIGVNARNMYARLFFRISY